MKNSEKKALEKEKLLMSVYAAFDESRLFQNIPTSIKQSMAEVAVAAFKPFVNASDKLAEMTIETDLVSMDTMETLQDRNRTLQQINEALKSEIAAYKAVDAAARGLNRLMLTIEQDNHGQNDRVFTHFEFDDLRYALSLVDGLKATATA